MVIRSFSVSAIVLCRALTPRIGMSIAVLFLVNLDANARRPGSNSEISASVVLSVRPVGEWETDKFTRGNFSLVD